ncbi:hypothetical protein [Aeromonas veronii]|uniref:InvB/SpaK family type III secretion system chaperone n=2 Tax=Aeromonas veronii TaxID=654 RepID=UPI003A86CF87
MTIIPPSVLQAQIGSMLTGLGLPLDTQHTLAAERTLGLQLEGLPDLMLSLIDGELWLWSRLQDLSANRLMDYAPAVLTQLITPVDGIQGGQLTLGEGEEGYELKGQVNPSWLEQEDGLLITAQGFIHLLTSFCHATRTGN